MTSTPVHVTRKRPTVAVLGTGIMGSGMARSLLRAGLGVRAWNRTQSKATPLAAEGATVTETAEEAVRGADVIVTMLNDGLSVAAALTAAASGVHGGRSCCRAPPSDPTPPLISPSGRRIWDSSISTPRSPEPSSPQNRAR